MSDILKRGGTYPLKGVGKFPTAQGRRRTGSISAQGALGRIASPRTGIGLDSITRAPSGADIAPSLATNGPNHDYCN